MDSDNRIQPVSFAQERASVQADQETSSETAPQESEGNMSTVSVASITPNSMTHQALISNTDHIMQLIGNPVRTLLALSENAYDLNESRIRTLQTLNPNELTISHNNLLEARERLDSMMAILLRSRYQTLPQYQTAVEHFNHTNELFNEALRLLHDENTRWPVYCHALQSAADAFSSFATSIESLREAQTTIDAASPPGAYHISAAEAAREGSFSYHDPQAHQEAVEAIPVNLPIAHLQPFPKTESALRLLRKAPYGPDGLNNVTAEAPMMAVDGIPVAEATTLGQEHVENNSTPKN